MDDRIVINGMALVKTGTKANVKEEVAMKPATVATNSARPE